MSRILLAYATRYGSTQEVAERIAAVLHEAGLEVDVQIAKKVRSLEGYSMVVLGAPIYVGQWLKPGRDFLNRHQAMLVRLPVAIFALGPLHEDPKEFEDVRPSFEKSLVQFGWLHPVSTALFTGSLDPAKLRFPDSMLTSLKASPLYGVGKLDERNWEAIQAWALSLAELAKQPA